MEEQERDSYAAVIDPAKIIVLDPEYQRKYDALIELKAGESKGSGPARNFVWDHSAAEGYARHWVMDDNIREFYRLHENIYGIVQDGTIIRCMEDFALRYVNVALTGPNYFMFAPRKQKCQPFAINTRVYSCILIQNDIQFRWRGRYNEDTDLSLRVLKEGWCTVLFNAFLQHKETTQKIAGGNTDAFYAKEGTGPKTAMLVGLHPDVTVMTKRWNRIHHYTDYRPFKDNRLVRAPGVTIPQGVNEYGMVRVEAQRQGGVPFSRRMTAG